MNISFQDEERTIPSKLKIIDWQLVSVRNSPIYDISILLYICASVEDLDNLRELLHHYYNSLYNFIKELGSDPEKLFPYDVFLNHWRRYNLFGFMLVPIMMKFLYCENSDINSENATNVDEYSNWLVETKIEDREYKERIIGLCRRFFSSDI